MEVMESYVQNHHLNKAMIGAYFAAVQGNNKAKLNLGFRLDTNYGMNGNCSAAALYYKDVCDQIYSNNATIKLNTLFIHKKHLELDSQFNQDKFWGSHHQTEEEEITQLLIQAKSGNYPSMNKKLGFIYYYG